jgi:hypothetical protein
MQLANAPPAMQSRSRGQKVTTAEGPRELTKYQRISSKRSSGAAIQVVLPQSFAGAHLYHATGNRFMRIKALAVLVLLAVSAVLFMQFRKDSRADAAASNCYSDAKGPSAPTLCN